MLEVGDYVELDGDVYEVNEVRSNYVAWLATPTTTAPVTYALCSELRKLSEAEMLLYALAGRLG